MRRWHAAAAFIAGGASVLAYAPVECWPLAALALGSLFWLLQQTGSARAGFATGFAYGLGLFLGGVSWLYVALNRYGNMPAPLAALAVLLFCSLLAAFPGMAGALFARLRSRRPLGDALLFAAVWMLVAEWLRGWVLTGFPWLASGYSQTPPSPLGGFLPVLGVYGVGHGFYIVWPFVGPSSARDSVEYAGDYYSYTLTLADVDNDNFSDLLVGAYVYANTRGRSYLYYGGT
ncbi:MAG: hypothetical protein HGA47_11930, partial [Zoogloea sp.]|nr:hypothetical protein [Zoogloea sp.]